MVVGRRVGALRTLVQALIGARRPGAPGVGERLAALPRMLSQGLRGSYPHLDRSRMLLVALGLLYVVSPVDLVPEMFIPLLGLGDDAVLVAWLAGTVLSETEAFLAWERDAAKVVEGEVIG